MARHLQDYILSLSQVCKQMIDILEKAGKIREKGMQVLLVLRKEKEKRVKEKAFWTHDRKYDKEL